MTNPKGSEGNDNKNKSTNCFWNNTNYNDI